MKLYDFDTDPLMPKQPSASEDDFEDYFRWKNGLSHKYNNQMFVALLIAIILVRVLEAVLLTLIIIFSRKRENFFERNTIEYDDTRLKNFLSEPKNEVLVEF